MGRLRRFDQQIKLHNRAASHVDGAASLLVGIAANQAMQTGQMMCIEDLFLLAEMMQK